MVEQERSDDHRRRPATPGGLACPADEFAQTTGLSCDPIFDQMRT